MNDKERIDQLISQNYIIKNIHIESGEVPSEITITFAHKGGGPPPQGEYITIATTNPDTIKYAYKIYNS